MKKETLYEAIGQIDDELIEKAESTLKIKKKKYWLRYSAVAACLCLITIIGILALPHAKNNTIVPKSENFQEDAIALDNNIIFADKQYIPLYSELAKEYGYEETVSQNQIGEKLGIVSEGNSKGKEVYTYIPANCDAVIVLKNDENYVLYSFSAFKSYINNNDEDMIKYLNLYGIHSYSDIKKVTIDGNEIKKDDIETFYNFFSALENSSNAYFNSLINYKDTVSSEIAVNSDYKTNMPLIEESYINPISDEIYSNGQTIIPTEPDAEVNEQTTAKTEPNVTTNVKTAEATEPNITTSGETAEASAGTVEGSAGTGTNALSNCHNIVIYSANGLFFETVYYPNIEFISRHKVNNDFIEFLNKYISY